jgi:hypothetical protein
MLACATKSGKLQCMCVQVRVYRVSRDRSCKSVHTYTYAKCAHMCLPKVCTSRCSDRRPEQSWYPGPATRCTCTAAARHQQSRPRFTRDPLLRIGPSTSCSPLRHQSAIGLQTGRRISVRGVMRRTYRHAQRPLGRPACARLWALSRRAPNYLANSTAVEASDDTIDTSVVP